MRNQYNEIADLIILGASMRPQLTNLYWSPRGSCALGALGEACGVYPRLYEKAFTTNALTELNERFPVLAVEHPYQGRSMRLSVIISWLNFEMTREKVAEWVRALGVEVEQKVQVEKEVG